MKKIVFILFVFFSFGLQARDIINFNEGWKFNLGDIKGAEKAYFKDESWRVLDLPHD